MSMTRTWAVWMLAYLTVVTCMVVEATRVASELGQFGFLCGNRKLQCPAPAAQLPRSFTLYHRPGRPPALRPRFLLFPSQVNFSPHIFIAAPSTESHDRISPLLAMLPFTAASDAVSMGNEVAPESLRGPGIPSTKGSLNFTYVESNARYLRLSPIKTRRVVHELRGKTLAAALAHLASSPRRPALAIFRTIESAISNAVQLHGEANVKPQLVSVTASNGPVMKRPFFKARGRLNVWRRPTTHIKVIIKAL